MRKLLTLLIVAILATTTAWAEVVTYQHVFKAKPGTGNNVALSGVNWNIEATNLNGYNSGNYAGVQIGSSSKNGSITLTSSSDWSYNGATKIKEVRLWLNMGGTSVTPTVTIGGKSATSDGTKVVKNSTAKTDWTKTSKVTFTPSNGGENGVIVIKVTSVKAGYICAMEIDCEEDDSPSKTKTTLSFGADLDGKAITKNLGDADFTHKATLTPAIEGATISYSSSDENVAIVEDGEVVLDKVGTTTIKAEYAGDDTYASASASYKLHVKDGTVAAGTYTIPVNNWLWGTNYNGAVSDAAELNGSTNGINIRLQKLGTTTMEVTDGQTLAGNSYTMTFTAPTGYAIQKINFTKGDSWSGNLTLNDGGGTVNGMAWVGTANSVSFSFGGKSYIKSVDVTYVSSVEKTATTLSFGADLDGKTITKYIGEADFTNTATLSPTIGGAQIEYTSSNENVALVVDGEVTLGNSEGNAVITAKYAGNGEYAASEASYTIDLKKLPINFSIPSESEVAAGTKLTISTIEGAKLTYQFEGEDVVEVNTNTTEVTINKDCYIDVVASYKGATSEAQALYTLKKAVSSIAITGEPTKTEYFVGETFDRSALKATATYSDNTTEDITAKASWTITPETLTEAGSKEVTVAVSYDGVTAQQTYTVTVKTIENTQETAYSVAEAIALIDAGKTDVGVYIKGIVSQIKTAYNNGVISFNVSDDGTATGSQFLFYQNQKDANSKYAEDPNIEVGATVIGYGTLYKHNSTYEFNKGNYLVSYTAPAQKEVESIAISGTPTKTSYEVGETFNPAGLTVTATYSDKTTEDVTANVTWSFNPATITETTESVVATATYEGKTAEDIFELKSLSSIAISGTPAKTSYKVGEKFDPAGLTVTATYSDNSTADITSTTTWDIDPATLSTEGQVTVTVRAVYEGKDDMAEYTVTVVKLPLTLTITPATGTYKTAQTVTIEATNAIGDYVICYSTDGSDPANGTEYTAPFTVSTTTTVKAYVLDNDSREATAESIITIEEEAFVAENFNNCNNQGGKDSNFNQGGGTISDDSFDNTGWTYSTIYEAKSSVRVGTGSKNGTLTSPAIKRTNYNAISFELAGWGDKATNTLTLTINNGGSFADGSTSKTFTATNGAWKTFTVSITGLTAATTFTFSGKRFFLDSIILQNLATLGELSEIGVVGNTYTVKDEGLMAVAKFENADKHYVVVKDNATAVKNLSAPADGDKFFDIAGMKQQDYAQNNWMVVEMPVEQYNTVEAFQNITSISGTLTDAQNTSMSASEVVMGDAGEPFTINAYCPINFMGVSSVASSSTTHPANYYFATPKANEYAKIVWAVYNATDGAFYLHAQSGSINTQGFKGAFKVDYGMNSTDAPELTDGSVYEFEAVVKVAAEAQSAPRKLTVDYDSSTTPSTKYVVCPINLQGESNMATGITNVATGTKAVKSVRYFSVTGVEANQPFDGVNIVVTTYTDGSSSAQKMLR